MKDNYINTLNTVDSVESYKKEIVEACDARIKHINMLKKADALSNKEFGYIKECFEAFAPYLFETKEGRNIIREYTSQIRGCEELSTLHSIYENIRRTSKNSDVDFLIESLISENINLDSKKTKESLHKLGLILAEAYMYLNNDSNDFLPKENYELDAAVKYITENKKSIKNISDFSSAVKVIKEEISKHEDSKTNFSGKDIDEIAGELMREFNEKYNDKLSDEEKIMIKELSENTNKENVFYKYKDMCASKINEAKNKFEKEGDSESVKRLNAISEQVSKKIYSEETVEKDICNLIEISSIF